MSASTFRFCVSVPRSVRIEGRVLDRDAFYSWIWETFSSSGLLGVHEGTLLAEQAFQAGLETETWALDAGEAPRDRDWVASQELSQTDLYFDSVKNAESARETLRGIPGLQIPGNVEEQKAQDWDAEWKASFQGVQVKPFWSILPPWVENGEGVILRINPGAGFGTGTHETTQLCLQRLGEMNLKGKRVLDFGSGSGVLSIAAALLGAEVDGVEIDPLAVENAEDNAKLNRMEGSVRFSKTLGSAHGPYDLVIANILKPVLLEFAPELIRRKGNPGDILLSGLMQGDVAGVSERYSSLLNGSLLEERALGEWRALVWKNC